MDIEATKKVEAHMNLKEFDALYDKLSGPVREGLDFVIKLLAALEKNQSASQ